MSDRCLVIVPTLNRAHRVRPLLDSLAACDDDRVDLVFVATEGDRDQLKAIRRMRANYLTISPEDESWAKKVNLAFRELVLPGGYEWALLGADDLVFHPGWYDAVLEAHGRSDACVVGTNDGHNRRVLAGQHSTHPVVNRDYWECGTIDEPNCVMHDGYRHWFCNPADAPIWMDDLSFKPLGDVRVGDQVIGWHRPMLNPSDPKVVEQIRQAEGSLRNVGSRFGVSAEHVRVIRRGTNGSKGRTWKAPLSRLCSSEVLAVKQRRSEIVRVVMASGRELRCTSDHRWLNACWSPSQDPRSQWVTAKVGRSLLHVIDESKPVHPEDWRLAGWLAGIYDGEGGGVYIAHQSELANQAIVEAIEDALLRLGIVYTKPKGFRPHGMVAFCLGNGRQGFVDFLNQIQPVKREKLHFRVVGSSRFGMRDEVVAVEPDGEEAVFSMTTSTGNYVVWGYASRNCDTEFCETAQARATYVHAHEAHVEHLHPLYGGADDDDTYRLGQSFIARDRRLFASRRRLWRG